MVRYEREVAAKNRLNKLHRLIERDSRLTHYFELWVLRYWLGYLSGVRCKLFTYGLADATATSSLASLKSRMVYISAVGLLKLSWKKGH